MPTHASTLHPVAGRLKSKFISFLHVHNKTLDAGALGIA